MQQLLQNVRVKMIFLEIYVETAKPVKFKHVDYIRSNPEESLYTYEGELIIRPNIIEFKSAFKRIKITAEEVVNIRLYRFPFYKWASDDIEFFDSVAIDTEEATYYFATLIKDGAKRFFARFGGREKVYDRSRTYKLYQVLQGWLKAHKKVMVHESLKEKLQGILRLSRSISLDTIAEALGISKGEVISLLAEVSSNYVDFPFVIENDMLIRKESSEEKDVERAIDAVIREFEQKQKKI